MTLYQIIALISDPARHFLLALSAGVLVYSAMSITFGVLCEIMAWRGVPTNSINRAAIGMLIISLLALISVSLLSHVGLDYASWWLNKPLGPPLNLKG